MPAKVLTLLMLLRLQGTNEALHTTLQWRRTERWCSRLPNRSHAAHPRSRCRIPAAVQVGATTVLDTFVSTIHATIHEV
jgi:hypothetical protein